jgi:segregation and condensation protein A
VVLDVSSALLRESYQKVMQNYRDRQNDETKKMNRILQHEKVSLRLKIKELLICLRKVVRLRFSKIFNQHKMSRLEVATGFLAALEIAKSGKARIYQSREFGEIYIERADMQTLGRET